MHPVTRTVFHVFVPWLLLTTVGATSPLRGQTASEVLSATFPIRTTASDDTDFSDLEPLIERVGDARIVQLGELSHGFGGSFDARIRITKFLHQRMGFDVILFETPMFLSRRMNRELAGTRTIEAVIDQSIFPIWGHSAQMLELFRYIRDSKDGPQPIDIFGIDAQLLNFEGEGAAIVQSISQVLRSDTDPVVSDLLQRLAVLIDDLRVDSGISFTGERFLSAGLLLTDLIYLLDAPSPPLRSGTAPQERAWWSRVLRTLQLMVEDRAVRALAPPFRGDFEEYARHPAVHAGQNRRDQAMARNIAWIAEDYLPGRRIVVWIANSHAQEEPGALLEATTDFPAVRQHTTGSYLTGMVGKSEVFTLLHSAYSGRYAGSFSSRDGAYVWSEYELEPAPDGTLEALLHEAQVRQGIVDLRALDAVGVRLRETLGDEQRSLEAYGDAVLFLDYDGPSRPR